MVIYDFYKPVSSVSPDEVRGMIEQKSIDQYCLLDVRQPSEYESGHLPGARLVPLGELEARLNEMNPEKPIVVYCRSGNRSHSAAGILIGSGFKEVYNMEGGISAYNGIKASGGPEAGMFCFPESLTPVELTAVAYLVENGTLWFLKGLKEILREKDFMILIDRLSESKIENKSRIIKLFKDLTGKEPERDFPKGVLETPPEDMMAGCVNVSDALKWAKGKSIMEVLEFMMAIEANAFDLYLKMGRNVKSKEAKKVFMVLSEVERRHLEIVTLAFEENL